ncbi:MotA/TolQ/ExbB proton channel family protein [Candidatus Uabimicrobium sp. HlEnr_7]|uniref:MotA/TolQ/ExbB proton channel family protein n=1 Tax=Candidatus Uabimicrobium helgolandensis TaxID=3095367 RepID=UPI003556E4E5
MNEVLAAGGVTLYVIIFCSVVALGFTIERLISFNQAKCNLNTFLPNLENSLKLGKWDEAQQHCQKTSGLIPRILGVGIKHKEESVEDIRLILIDEVQINALPTLNKNLNILSTIAKGTPMLGLLGTVLGMIEMFEVIAGAGLGNPKAMANGIRLALFTTAAGMMVAIPIIFVHAYFKTRIRSFERDTYNCLTKFIRLVRRRKEVSS